MLLVNYRERYSPLKDIDIDLAPSKRPKIFEAIRKERGEFGLVQVATFGTEGTKSAILTACRGYRGQGAGYNKNVSSTGFDPDDTYADGIDVDDIFNSSGAWFLMAYEGGCLWKSRKR